MTHGNLDKDENKETKKIKTAKKTKTRPFCILKENVLGWLEAPFPGHFSLMTRLSTLPLRDNVIREAKTQFCPFVSFLKVFPGHHYRFYTHCSSGKLLNLFVLNILDTDKFCLSYLFICISLLGSRTQLVEKADSGGFSHEKSFVGAAAQM